MNHYVSSAMLGCAHSPSCRCRYGTE